MRLKFINSFYVGLASTGQPHAPRSPLGTDAPGKRTTAFPERTLTYKLSCFEQVVFIAPLTEILLSFEAHFECSFFQESFLTKLILFLPLYQISSLIIFMYVHVLRHVPLSALGTVPGPRMQNTYLLLYVTVFFLGFPDGKIRV